MPKNLPFYPLFLLLLLFAGCKGDRNFTPQPIMEPDDAARKELHSIIGSTERADSVFAPDIARLLPALDSVEAVLGKALGSNSGVTLYGVIIPYRQSIITTPGGHIFIGLNHYLGADYEGYRGVFPSYLRHRKSVNRIPVDVMQARIASLFPPEYGANPALINRMLYQGALLETANENMDAPDATLLGLTPEEIKWCEENEANLWQSMMKADLIYSTDPTVADRLLSPAPNSNLLSGNAPGQAALFTAVKIIRAYCKKNGVTARQVLEKKLYNDNQTLINSQYAPIR